MNTSLVLIVETEIGKMELVYTILMREGFSYGFARSREDALKLIATNAYDVVIMNYALVGMSVGEFITVLGELDSKISVILTFSKSETRHKFASKHCKWLAVPCTADELLNLLPCEEGIL